MSGKVFVAYIENYDNYAGDIIGVFSTAKRAKAAFGDVKWINPDPGVYVSHHFNQGRDFIVVKTKIDEVMGHVG